MKNTLKNIFCSICAAIAVFISMSSFKSLELTSLSKLYSTNVFGMMIVFSLIVRTLFKEKVEISKSKKVLCIILTIFMILGESAQSVGRVDLAFYNIATFTIFIFKLIGFNTIFKICFYYLDIFLNNFKNKEINLKNSKMIKFINWFDRKPFLSSFIMILLVFSIYIIAFYPIVLSPDPSNQILQYYNVKTNYVDWAILRDPNVFMTNHHPVMQTYLLGFCIDLGRSILNDNFGLFIYTFIQTLIYASVLAYTIKFLKNNGVSIKLRLILLSIYLVVPHYAFYSVSAVKDTLYTSFMILLVLFMIDLVRSYKDKKLSNWYIFYITIVVILMSLMRHNGFYIAFISFITLILYSRKNGIKLLIALLVFSTVIIGFNKIIIPKLKIADASIREVLSVPFQQTARLVKYHDKDIETEDKEDIDKILTYDTLASRYDPRLADDVKNKYNKYATKEDLKDYFIVWFKYLVRYPITYVNATVDNMYGYIYPNQHYWYVYDTYDKRITKNGLVDYHFNKNTEFMRNTLIFYESIFPYIPGIGLISSIGFQTWIVLIISFYLKKKREMIYMIPLYLSIAICFVSPANTYFRYAMPYIFVLPTIVLLNLNKERRNKDEEK